MLQGTIIGYIGSDAETKVSNGNQFTTMRIAHSDKWTDEKGNVHESTQWVDVVLNGRPNVVDYLKRGTQVFVSGNLTARIYSSAKDKCMKAGITINARTIELLGGKADEVPSRLYDMDGVEHAITKWYYAADLTWKKTKDAPDFKPLVSRSGAHFVVDSNGWVKPHVEPQEGQADG